MTDNPLRFESIPWRRVLPWLALTRAFWIAVDLRKLLLAAAGLLLVSAGSLVFDQLPFGREARQEIPWAAQSLETWPWDWRLGYDVHWTRPDDDLLVEFRGILEHPLETVRRVLGNWQIVLHPIRAMAEPSVRLFRGNCSWAQLADAVTRLIWALAVWSIFGGAIGRIAAVQFARDQQIGIREALLFAASRFLGYVSAPFLPLTAVAALWALCVVGGWLGRIPGGVGEVVLALLWGLELVLGLMMAVILIGIVGGWPLMMATIGVEGTDGFDALSRMYNYVFERPLYYIWQIGVVVVYGSAVIFFVGLMAQMLVHLALWGVSWGYGYSETAQLLSRSPAVVLRRVDVAAEQPGPAPGPVFDRPAGDQDPAVERAAAGDRDAQGDRDTGEDPDSAGDPNSADEQESPGEPDSAGEPKNAGKPKSTGVVDTAVAKPASPKEPIDSLGRQIARGWMCGLTTLVFGFIYSYFWTSATIMYFTLRRSVDANDFDEVYLPDEQEADELLPLVGAAGMGTPQEIAAAESKAPSEGGAAEPPVDLTP